MITANSNTSKLNISLTIKYYVTHLRKKKSIFGITGHGKEVNHVGGTANVVAVWREIAAGKIILDSTATVTVSLWKF